MLVILPERRQRQAGPQLGQISLNVMSQVPMRDSNLKSKMQAPGQHRLLRTCASSKLPCLLWQRLMEPDPFQAICHGRSAVTAAAHSPGKILVPKHKE